MPDHEPLIPKHGGFRKLITFKLGQLIYDLTASFCDLYIARGSRTHDQMEQAARSGVQNIAEGSQVSGTSKKLELNLTGVARASLEELRLDYEDFLRQRGLAAWEPSHPALVRFKARRCATLEDVRAWAEDERRRAEHGHTDDHGRARTGTDEQRPARAYPDEHGPNRANTDRYGRNRANTNRNGLQRAPRTARPAGADTNPILRENPPLPTYRELAANAALSLLNLCCHLLDRQLNSQADTFEREGGFTERLYHRRKRKQQNPG